MKSETLHLTYRVIESTDMERQFRVPRSKKRRIRNKWAKNRENYCPIIIPRFDHSNKTVTIHPMFAGVVSSILTDTQ